MIYYYHSGIYIKILHMHLTTTLKKNKLCPLVSVIVIFILFNYWINRKLTSFPFFIIAINNIAVNMQGL